MTDAERLEAARVMAGPGPWDYRNRNGLGDWQPCPAGEPLWDWYAVEYRLRPPPPPAPLPSRPAVVCLCGSTRFGDAFRDANLRETLAGNIVLSIGCDFKSDQGLGLTDADKERLDELHKRKIDMADEVLILNVGGYIGKSTCSERDYAAAHGKCVRYLEPTPLPTPAPTPLPCPCPYCGAVCYRREENGNPNAYVDHTIDCPWFRFHGDTTCITPANQHAWNHRAPCPTCADSEALRCEANDRAKDAEIEREKYYQNGKSWEEEASRLSHCVAEMEKSRDEALELLDHVQGDKKRATQLMADANLAADNCRAALRLAEQERDAAANRAEAAERRCAEATRMLRKSPYVTPEWTPFKLILAILEGRDHAN